MGPSDAATSAAIVVVNDVVVVVAVDDDVVDALGLETPFWFNLSPSCSAIKGFTTTFASPSSFVGMIEPRPMSGTPAAMC
jgi:hypothetical protein